jgi:hypothetical protein
MKAPSVLSAMPAPCNHCPHTGVSLPECSCRECCRALVARYAPALLDQGPLDVPCCTPTPLICTIESFAELHGIPVAELRRRSTLLEVEV